MKKNCRIVIIISTIGLLTTGLFEESRAQDGQRSREIITSGVQMTLSGSLKPVGGRWFIAVENVLHEIILGHPDYIESEGVSLEEGKEVVVNGYFHAEADEATGVMAVCTLEMDGRKYRFREDDGTPLWGGRGTGAGLRQRNQ